MTTTVAIYVFPDVEVLDFAGPYQVFTTASRVFARTNPSSSVRFSVFTISHGAGTIRARHGLVITPDHTFASHPSIDLLIIPGGVVTAELKNPNVSEWIKRTAASVKLTASICTGSFLLAQAGLLDGRTTTTHWEDVADLRGMFPSLTVLENRRWIDEGDVVTSAGISAGIDMSLYLVQRLVGKELALRTARQMDYVWHEEA
jgi:transcriptional regulator GlxA family with amidase domain